MAEYEKKREDRISELPEPLLHDILSRISLKDVVRTCILSKRWNYIWKTFPFLNFNKEKFYVFGQNPSWKNADLMEKGKLMILSRCQEENPILLKLLWVIPQCIIPGIGNSNLQLNTFLPNLAKTRLQELSIINNFRSELEEYLKLPSSPLIMPNSLRKLHFNRLQGFKSLVPYDNVKFKYLSTIALDDVVRVDDEAVNGLNLVCPYLESLRILNCSGLKNIHLSGLRNLKSIVLMRSSLKTLKIESLPHIKNLAIEFNKNLSGVDIINTSIASLCIKFNKNLSRLDITNMNLDSVLELKLYGNFLTQKFFDEFVCKCRFLELLDIDIWGTENSMTINISMDMLKRISIKSRKNVAEIKITAHALVLFRLVTSIYSNPPIVSWKSPNPKTKVFLVLISENIDDIIRNNDKLEIWQDFFRYFSHTEELEFIASPQFLTWLKRKGSNSPLPRVKYISYSDAIFGSSFPPILHLLESLVFLAPQVTTISFNNNAYRRNPDGSTLKIEYGGKKGGKTANNPTEFLGIEAWLFSVSKVTIEKYQGREYNWNELIKFLGKIKNLEIVLPEKKNRKFVY